MFQGSGARWGRVVLSCLITWFHPRVGAADPATTRAAPAIRYEAEDAELADGTVRKEDVHASGGAFVQFGKTGSMTWRVAVPTDGRYEMILRYRTASSDRAEILAVNGADRGIGFGMSANEWVEMRTVRRLKAGANDITLRADRGQIDIDLLRFDVQPRGRVGPLVEYPQVRPARNTYYRASSEGIRLFLEPGSHRLTDVTGPGGAIPFSPEPSAHVDDALLVTLQSSTLRQLPLGTHRLLLRFDGGVTIPYELDVRDDESAAAPWVIYTLNVQHGTAVVMRLPGGKIAMIDTATREQAEHVVVPFLKRQGIKRIDYLFITHYHDDHAGGLPLIEGGFEVGQKYDYDNVRVKDSLDIDGVRTTVLNSKESGADENSRSLALRMEFNGFVYLHGGDNYGQNQEKQLALFAPEELRANLFHANHHFHGSVDADFCRVVDPQLVIVSAQQAVYARAAFVTIYREKVERYLHSVGARLRETLLTNEVGHVVVRVRSGEDWSYETAPQLESMPPFR